jgi:hypothetical protein
MTTTQPFVLVSSEDELLAGMKSYLSNDLKVLIVHNDPSYGSSLLSTLKGLFPTKNFVTTFNASTIANADAFIQDLNTSQPFSYATPTFAVRFLHITGTQAPLQGVLNIPNVAEKKTFFFFDRSRSLIKMNDGSKTGVRSERIKNVFDEEIRTRGSGSLAWYKKLFTVLDTLSPVLMDIEHFIQQLITSPSSLLTSTPTTTTPSSTPSTTPASTPQ